MTNTELSDVLEAVNVKSSFLWCDTILVGRFLLCRWRELVTAKRIYIYICQTTASSAIKIQAASRLETLINSVHAMKALGRGGTAALIFNFETR